MQPRVFAIITAVLLGALGLGAVAVTDWTPSAASTAGRAAPAAKAVAASASPPAIRRSGPAARCATS